MTSILIYFKNQKPHPATVTGKIMEQITQKEEGGYTWIIDACEYIDNKEALEGALSEIGASYRVDEDGNLFANVEDVKRADTFAYEKSKI